MASNGGGGYNGTMRRPVSIVSLCLVLLLALAPGLSGVSRHCDQHHGQAEMTGHGTEGHPAAPEAPADGCDHCPPTDCATAAPCAGNVLDVNLRTFASPRVITVHTRSLPTLDRLTTRAPEPTYPPPRLA